jgi:hypothetical protein
MDTSIPHLGGIDIEDSVDSVFNCRKRMSVDLSLVSKSTTSSAEFVDAIDAFAFRDAIIHSFFAKNTYTKWR